MTIKKNESPAGADGHGLMDCTIGLEMGRCAVDGGRWTVEFGTLVSALQNYESTNSSVVNEAISDL